MSSTLTQKRNELSAPEMGHYTTIPTGEVYHSSQNQLALTTVQHRSHTHQCAVGRQHVQPWELLFSSPILYSDRLELLEVFRAESS